MSSTNKTNNLGLNQWLGNDISAREDFNNDNKKIDDWAGEVDTSLNAMGKYFELSPQEDINIQIPSGEVTAITNYANISSEDFLVYENKYFKPLKKGIYLITVQFPFYNLPSGTFGRALIHVVRSGGTEQRYHLGTTVGGDTWNPVANTTTIKINSDDVFYFSAFQNSGNSITQATQIVRITKLKEV